MDRDELMAEERRRQAERQVPPMPPELAAKVRDLLPSATRRALRGVLADTRRSRGTSSPAPTTSPVEADTASLAGSERHCGTGLSRGAATGS
jgi:hypothetical protein